MPYFVASLHRRRSRPNLEDLFVQGTNQEIILVISLCKEVENMKHVYSGQLIYLIAKVFLY